MRLLVVILAIFAATVALGFWTNHMLAASTDKLMQNIEKISAELDKNRWDTAYRQTSRLEGAWEKEKKWWPTVMDHQEIDNIEFSLAKTKEYISTQNIALSRGQLSELRLMIKHIPEKESVNIKNIL